MSLLNESLWVYLHKGIENQKRSVFFRKSFQASPQKSMKISVSADSRYKLYVNGEFAGEGPVTGNRFYTYYDEVEIAPYVVEGKNIIAVHLLKFPYDPAGASDFETGPVWLSGTTRGGLWINGGSKLPQINTNNSWKLLEDRSYQFVLADSSKYAGDQEDVDGAQIPTGWLCAGFDDSNWGQALEVAPATGHKAGGVMLNWQLLAAPIPAQHIEPVYVKKLSRQNNAGEFDVLLEGKEVRIPACTKTWVEFDMGEIVTAYVNFKAFGDGTVKLLYGESYYHKDKNGYLYKKVRSDSTGIFHGEQDSYRLKADNMAYEPYFYRTFRFLRMEIETGEKEICLNSLSFMQTAYPLVCSGSFSSPNEDATWLWDISVRTLKRCMHESFVDSPYYERMQYTMDALLQMLISFQLSDDERLAKKSIMDFAATQRPDGLLNCNAPSATSQIIPGFSLLFIDMIYYYTLYQGDFNLLEKQMPVVERILYYFKSKIDLKTGLATGCGYWEFVDWVEVWHDDFGTPMKKTDTVNIIYNMMYAYALEKTASLYELLKLKEMAALHRRQKQALIAAINEHAVDKSSGFYQTSPGDMRFSQHAQIWAVLSGCADNETARCLMTECLTSKVLLPVSFSMTFFLFRALEKTGMYENSHSIWENWLKMRKMDISTWPEDLVTQRSDCHGWGAIPIYEFLSSSLGLRPLLPGWKKILAAPSAHALGDISGEIPTPEGVIKASRKKNEKGNWVYWLQLPKKMDIEFDIPGTINKMQQENTYCIEYNINKNIGEV